MLSFCITIIIIIIITFIFQFRSLPTKCQNHMPLNNLSHKSCNIMFWGTIWIMENTAFFCLESAIQMYPWRRNVCHLRFYAVKSSTIQALNKAFIVLALTLWNKPTLNIRLVRWVRAFKNTLVQSAVCIIFVKCHQNTVIWLLWVWLCLSMFERLPKSLFLLHLAVMLWGWFSLVFHHDLLYSLDDVVWSTL